MRYTFQKGATSKSIEVLAVNAADNTPRTDLVFNTAGLSASYTRSGAAATAITLATLASSSAAYSSGGFVVITGNLYRLDIPDAAIATGVDKGRIHFILAGVLFEPVGYDLTADDPNAAGLTSAVIAAAVVDLATAGHTAAGTFGAQLKTVLDDVLTDTADIQPKIGTPNTNLANDAAVEKGVVDQIRTDTLLLLTADVAYKRNIAVTAFEFFMRNTDGTPGTGKTVTASISKDGGAFAGVAGAITELTLGWYKVNLTATEMDADEVGLNFTAAGCFTTPVKIRTQS